MPILKKIGLGVVGAVGVFTAAVAIDIATNELSGDALPADIDILQTEPTPLSFGLNQVAHIYVEGADSRLDTITAMTTDEQSVELNRVYEVDDDISGFTAAAYREEGGDNVVIIFNGMSKPWVDMVMTPDENPWQSWDDVLTGVESRLGIVNRQMPALYEFMSELDEQFEGQDVQYQTITYSLGGIHGLHALAEWNIPHTGLSPAGLPSHTELYADESRARLSADHSVSYTTPSDFITGSVGQTGNMAFLEKEGSADSIGPHILPTGYFQLSQ